MSEMVERVAAAMWDKTHDGSWEDRGDGQDESRDIHLEDARAAIAEMRDFLIELGASGSSAYDPAIEVLNEALNDVAEC